jgi:hypothetical protein
MRLLSAFGLTLVLACNTGGAGAPLDAGDPPRAQLSRNVPFQTVAQASVPGGAGGPVREAIHGDDDWRTVWSELGAAGGPPRVDFSRNMVILVAMETQSCVSKITVERITETAEGLRIDLLEQSPGPNCVCITSERPYHAVRLPQTDTRVYFEARRGFSNC